jgi:hypothetical protein
MTRLRVLVFLALCAPALWAQDKNPAGHSATASPPAREAQSVRGALTDGVYRNPSFGFSYRLPYGWVGRTKEMQDDSAETSGDLPKSLLLLSIFERPPEATGDTVNSAVVIAAERLSNYAGLKTAADYLGQLAELATAKGFQAVKDPYPFPVGPAQLIRGDFSKARGTGTVSQTSLVVVERGYEVSFTFIASSEDEINELVEKLSFGARKH